MKYDLTKINPEYRRYVLRMSSKSEYIITGLQEENIRQSKSQFIKLNGSTINKAFMVEIVFLYNETKYEIMKLPLEERKAILLPLEIA